MAVSRKKNMVPAFNLVPVVEQFFSDRQIECVCGYERHLYVGTSDGLVVHYQVDETVTPFGKKLYQCTVKARKQLDGDRRKPVQQLTVIPKPYYKLLVLLDGTLMMLDMHKLELSDKINKVLCFCTNEGRIKDHSTPPEVVVAPQRKKLLSVYIVSSDRLQHVRDHPLADQAVAMAKDGPCVCVALSGGAHNGDYRYIMVHLDEGGRINDLLSYEPSACPMVRRTNKNEFLINAGDFGVIASITGMSNRPPVAWANSPPTATAYVFPYVVVWSLVTSSVLVYSLMDQRCVQEITFTNCRHLSQFQGKVYAALDNSIYMLVPVPLKDQVDQLLDKHLVEEAIILAETIAAVDSSTKHTTRAEQFIGSIKEKAAMIMFCAGKFSQAEVLFYESNTDPRKVIGLFEGVLPPGSSYERDTDITAEQLAKQDKISLKEAKRFLIRYIKEVRSTAAALGRREDIDTALIKLLAESRSKSLVNYLSTHELHLDLDDTRQALQHNKCYHALGLLLYHTEQPASAIKMWIRICDGDIQDDMFPGFEFIVDFLCKLSDIELLFQHARWALDRREEEGVRVFTGRSSPSSSDRRLDPANVLEYLSSYPIATMLYLEYLINTERSKEEFFHTRLASMYLDDLLAIDKDGNAAEYRVARRRLKAFLVDSTHYRASVLLHRVQDTAMYHECVILYGRMEEHEKALMLLVHQLQDYTGAEQYCMENSVGRSRVYRQGLHLMLLSVFLRPADSSHEPLITPALHLINTQGAEFDAAQVLQMLPSRWNLSTVRQFLMRSIRNTNTTHKTSRIEHNLARGENLQTRVNLIRLQGDPVVISDSKVCPVCQLPFNDAAFVRYPNGTITHLRCGRNKTICPITGTWFGADH